MVTFNEIINNKNINTEYSKLRAVINTIQREFDNMFEIINNIETHSDYVDISTEDKVGINTLKNINIADLQNAIVIFDN